MTDCGLRGEEEVRACVCVRVVRGGGGLAALEYVFLLFDGYSYVGKQPCRHSTNTYLPSERREKGRKGVASESASSILWIGVVYTHG